MGKTSGSVTDALRKDLYMRPSAEVARTFIASLMSSFPVPAFMTPTKIVCIGWNYRSHVKELDSDYPEFPTVFLKPPSCLIGNGDDIVIPEGVTNVQHEAELALVFGTRCKNVSEEDAMSHVSHLAAFNDVTARDMQSEARRAGNTWDLSKGIDTFGAMSDPVPIESVGDPQDLGIELTVNGEVRQSGRTSDMIFSLPFLVSYVSRFMTMEPGDVLITGTPEGVSEIRPGDTVVVRIEGVGELTNRVV